MKILSNLARAIVTSQPQYPDIHLVDNEWDLSNSPEWARLIQEAEGGGLSVDWKVSGIHISLGEDREIFNHPSQLAKAKKFVKGLI